jgi:predicted metal-binding membrane protein
VALVAGYLAMWSLFAVLVASAQAWLTTLGLVTYEGRLASQLASGVLLTAAGLYQFTPWKGACIALCRSPFTFLAMHWRGGMRGALSMGAVQGMYCVGCCWLLFAALFALGTMNIGWMAALLAVLLAERRPRLGPWVTWGAGLAATAYGLSLLMLR